VPVRGGVVTNDSPLRVSLAEQGLGLAYVVESMVAEHLREGRLQRVLEAYAPTVPGFFLYFPSRAQRSPALRLFVDAARELAVHAVGAVPRGSWKAGASDKAEARRPDEPAP
jgi:DNA-binding transcriptional LysR family regulator